MKVFTGITKLLSLLLVLILAALGCERFKAIAKWHEQELIGNPTVFDKQKAEMAVIKIISEMESGEVETGSGMFLAREGIDTYFLTAYHVVEEAEIFIEIKDYPNRRFKAELLKADEDLDIAIIKTSLIPYEAKDNFYLFHQGQAENSGSMKNHSFGVLYYRDITPNLKKYKLKNTSGLLISNSSEGSNAYRSGLREGDLILKINNKKINNFDGLKEILNAVNPGAKVNFEVERRGKLMSFVVTKKTNPDSISVVYTIGHPAGNEWSWQAGYILNYSDKNKLDISGELVPSGVSGAPLFDKYYRLIGIALEKQGRNATATRIEPALKFAEEMIVPMKFWLTDEFCYRLKKILPHEDSDFDSLKVGAGQKHAYSFYEWEWPAVIDITGVGKSNIVKKSSSRTVYKAEMVKSCGLKGGELIKREIARKIKKCFPDIIVSEDDYGLLLELRKEGFLANSYFIHIQSGTNVEIEIY